MKAPDEKKRAATTGEPASSSPPSSKPASGKSASGKSASGKSASGKSASGKPAATKPAATKPAATKPVAIRSTPGDAAGRGSLKSMHKVMAVLDSFSRYDRSLSLNDISLRCGMPKTTVHRIVSSLREVKLLEQEKGRDRYKLGIRLFELGSMVLANLDVVREARPLIDRLINVSGQGSHLCVFDGTNMVMVEHREPHRESVNWTTTLSISPSYCTGVGKAALAFQPDAAVERVVRSGLIPYTPRTITDPAKLRAELAQIRGRGYSIDEGEHQPDVRCVAAPVFNGVGQAFAALSVTGPMTELKPEHVPALAALVMASAQELSRQLGYDGVEYPPQPRASSRRTSVAQAEVLG